MPLALTDTPRSWFWSQNRLCNILEEFGRFWARELVGFGLIWSDLVGAILGFVPGPWYYAKILTFSHPLCLGVNYCNLCFCCYFLASLEIDAQEIKVVLSRVHVFQKNHPIGIGVPCRGFGFLGNT